jgi:hypothetical protein
MRLVEILAVPSLLTALGALGCVSSATDLKPANVPSSEGALFGSIEVQNDGKPVTGSCYLGLTDSRGHQKANLSLDKSGWVFTSVKRGPTYLSDVLCTLGGFIKYNATFHSRELLFDVEGQGTIAYFGHAKIEMNSAGSDVVAATIVLGALGNALASADEGARATVEVRDELRDATLEYLRRYGRAALLKPMLALAAAPGRGATPPPPATRQANDSSADDRPSGVIVSPPSNHVADVPAP